VVSLPASRGAPASGRISGGVKRGVKGDQNV